MTLEVMGLDRSPRGVKLTGKKGLLRTKPWERPIFWHF